MICSYQALSFQETGTEPDGSKRVRKRKLLVQENGGSHPLSISDLGPWTAWAYKPHTVLLLLLIGSCFLM